MITVSEIVSHLFGWAPKSLAWEKDNIGLIVGDPSQPVTSVLVTLDVTDAVIEEAAALGANVVVAHHPPIFTPLKTLRSDVAAQAALMRAIRRSISIIAMHTNVDAAGSGLNAALAAELGLLDVRPLDGLDDLSRRVTLRIACERGSETSAILHCTDAGRLHAVIRNEQSGLFTLEVDVEEWSLTGLLSAVAVIPGVRLLDHTITRITTGTVTHGIGSVGRLPAPVAAGAFAAQVRDALGAQSVRVSTGDMDRPICTVAVCGGSGASLIGRAVAAGADAFVTADLKYHDFTEYRHALMLIDAGHHETERPFISTCAMILSGMHFPDTEKISIFTTATDTNPIRFV